MNCAASSYIHKETTLSVLRVGFKFILWQVSYRTHLRGERKHNDIILNAQEKPEPPPLMLSVSMTPGGPRKPSPRPENHCSLYVCFSIKMLLTSTSVPAHTSANPPHTGSPVPGASPENFQVEMSSLWLFPRGASLPQGEVYKSPNMLSRDPEPLLYILRQLYPHPPRLADILSYFLNFFRLNFFLIFLLLR